METFSDFFRKLTGYATINYNQNPQVCFWALISPQSARSVVKKLVAFGFNAHVSGIDKKIIIVDLFNLIQK